MPDSIFLLRDDDELVSMTEEGYVTEDHLQDLLARYPQLLSGEQVDPRSPRRWLLILREAGIPDAHDRGNRWAVDHLFLDQDGVPTLVEVKRSTDSRIRREVVGQMLDYAANAVVYWPHDAIRQSFEKACQKDGRDASAVVEEFLAGDTDEESFWRMVKDNLQAQRVRLVFVADRIPPELQRIVEFLNGQMERTEVLALEVKQYKSDRHSTLVPRVLGRTADAQRIKDPTPSKHQWDEASFFAELAPTLTQLRYRSRRSCLVGRRTADQSGGVKVPSRAPSSQLSCGTTSTSSSPSGPVVWSKSTSSTTPTSHLSTTSIDDGRFSSASMRSQASLCRRTRSAVGPTSLLQD